MGLNGPRDVDFESLAGTTPLIISVWASWCRPCRDELKALNQYVANSGSRVRVLTVLAADREEASLLITEIAPALPVAYDRDTRLFTALGVASAIPTVVFVHPDGGIARVYQGPSLDTSAKLREVAESAFTAGE
jgi:hypothetical protein